MDMKKRIKRKRVVPESISQHIEEEYRKSKEFRKAYDEEVLRLKVAYKIAQLRKSRHLTQRELADRVGTTQQNISRLEDLENTQISLSTLTKLAIALKARVVIGFLPR